MNIYEKLMTIQTKLNCPKDLYNGFGKYHYRSAESILESVKPLLTEVKVALTLTDNIEQIGDRFYVRATATLIDTEKLFEKIEVTALAREEEAKKGMDGSQVTGASSSYARKYALNGLFCIDDTKDSDATNTHGKEVNKPVTQHVNKILTDNQVNRLFSIAKSKNYTAAEVKTAIIKKYGVTEIAQLSKVDYDHVVDGYSNAPIKGVK